MSSARISKKAPHSAVAAADELAQIRVDSHCLLAEWQASSRSEGVATIREHLDFAIEKASKMAAPQRAAHKAHYQYGRLMDRTALVLLNRQQSMEFEAASAALLSQGKEVARLHEELLQLSKDKDESKAKHVRDLMIHYQRLKLEYDLDVEEQRKFSENVHTSLQQSVEQYCECLITGDEYDSEVLHRLVSLWFTHHAKMSQV